MKPDWREYEAMEKAILKLEAALAERDARIAELEAAFKCLHSLHGTNFGYVLANTVDDYYHKLFPEKYNPHKEFSS